MEHRHALGGAIDRTRRPQQSLAIGRRPVLESRKPVRLHVARHLNLFAEMSRRSRAAEREQRDTFSTSGCSKDITTCLSGETVESKRVMV